MTAREKAYSSQQSAPHARPRMTPKAASGDGTIPFLTAGAGQDRTTLTGGLRRWLDHVSAAWRKLNVPPPSPIRTVAIAAIALGAFLVMNVAYHVIRKPTEIFFPLSGALKKMPAETWRQYGPLFKEYSTAFITPELLAALAQVESAGNPVARTYWRWRLTWNPFEIYRPASSAVGMYQLTDATFADARRYCIRNHAVVEEGSWSDWRSCWFNGFYSRVVPGHAIELTAASLDRSVARILARRPKAKAGLRQVQDLAAIIHLCGAGRAKAFAQGGFQLKPGDRCGDHDAATYVAAVNAMERQFRRLAAEH